MKGLRLNSLYGTLEKVPKEYAKDPTKTIRDVNAKLGKWLPYEKEAFMEEFEFFKDYHLLPLSAFRRFSFDELCKLWYSHKVSMKESVENLFITSARHEFVRKIISSLWRWGHGTGTWNEIVDAYNDIRSFSLELGTDFEIRLDYTRHSNECGRAKYSGIFLDGVFAYLIYYRGRHAMTIGFTIMEHRNVLIQQVQLASRKGNRFLYRFPENRMEFIIELFQKHFPGYQLYVIDARDMIDKYLSQYANGLIQAHDWVVRYQNDLRAATDNSRAEKERWLKEKERERAELKKCISHLRTDKPRLVKFYKNTGKFKLGRKSMIVNNLAHYPLAA